MENASHMDKIANLLNINPAQLDLPTLDKLATVGELTHPPRILMLYGSLRERSFSRFLTAVVQPVASGPVRSGQWRTHRVTDRD